MHITCPSCQRVIPLEDVNIQVAIAKCTACSEVFSIAPQAPVQPTPMLPGISAPPPGVQPQSVQVTPAVGGVLGQFIQRMVGAPATTAKTDVGLPTGFTAVHEQFDLVITRRWFSCGVLPLIPFCIIWDGFLVVWYTIAFTRDTPLIMKLFPIGHLAVGVYLTYTCLTGLFNRTEFRVNPRTLAIRHYPFWWPGARAIDVSTIDQLFCEEVYGQRGSRTYKLGVQLKDGNRIDLVKNLNQPNEARYLEQEIEKRLGIADRVVPGEMYAP
jgi:hypothetical protein